jgi:predicted methyltransferase
MYQRLILGISLLFSCVAPLGAAVMEADTTRLTAILTAQPAEKQARFGARHPQQTLEFFGVRPGMTVVEVLPGGGWYSAILVPYLGAQGRLVGADYPLELWPNFSFADDKYMAQKLVWVDEFPVEAKAWQGDDGATVTAGRLGSLPKSLDGSVDAVLFIRAMHNLNRFEDKGGFRTTALADAFRVLKPGGIVGVVQHEAPEGRSDGWADGSQGYLNRGELIHNLEAAGFEFVESSDINQNSRDVPGVDDIVWRLPPSYMTSRDKPELKAEYTAIGESNRMTLLFRKPAA